MKTYLRTSIIGLLGICLIPLLSFSQESKYDIAFNRWQDSTLTEEQRLESFYSILDYQFRLFSSPPPEEYRHLWYNSLDSALVLVEKYQAEEYRLIFLLYELIYEMYQLRENGPDKCVKFEVLLDQAIQHGNKQDIILAISYYYLFNLKCSNIKYNEEERISILNKNMDEFLKEFESKQEFSDETEKPKIRQIITTYTIIAHFHKERSEYPKALPFYLHALSIAKKFDEIGSIGPYGIEGIGIIHMDIGNYVEAEKYYLEALELAKKQNHRVRIGSTLNELSRLYLKMNKPQKALEMAEKAIAVMAPESESNLSCKVCIHETYTSEAGAYNVMGDHETALNKLLKIRDHYEDSESGAAPYGYAYYFAELATSYLGLKDYNKAVEAATKSLSFTSGRTFNETRRAYDIIYQSQKVLGDFQASLNAYERQTQIKDSMTVLRNAQEVTRLELESAFEKEQLENTIVFQKELSRQKSTRNLLIALGIGVLIIAIGLFYRLRFIRKTKEVLQTKNKAIESEKEKAKASEKAKQQFLANMSHEIRTPMNAIKGMTDILLRRNPVNEQLGYLNAIKESSHSLLVIINDILDISKLEAGKVELEEIDFSLEKVLENVKTIMGFKAEEKSLNLKVNMELGTPNSLNGDPTRLHQILINLVGNAIKFTEEGEVRIDVQKPSKTESGKSLFQFSVTDTGIGMDADRIDKIFQSFEQAYADTSRKYGGTGLGLSISKQLVELQDGRIWVESKKEKGSIFHFEIPYTILETVQEKAKSENNLSIEQIAANLKGIRVLLVEDNQFNAIVAQEELEDSIEGVEVVVAENGEIAVEKIKNEDFDIVLMDVQMPVMNGYDSTKAIRNLENGKPKTPIIAMTANVMKEEIERCYEAGMDDFIGKPFEVEDLLEKMNRLIVNKQANS